MQVARGLKLLRTTDITSGQIDWSTVPFCTEPPPDVRKYLVHEGDILISRAGSVGVSHLVRFAEPAVFASYLIRFRPGPDVLPKYLAYFLQSPSYWKQIADNTVGIAVPNVNASKLQELELPLAPPDEQERIVAEIEKQFSRLDEAEKSLKRVQVNLNGYEGAVLRAAVEGRLVPTEAELARLNGRGYETGAQLLQRLGESPRSASKGRRSHIELAMPDTARLPPLPEGWTWAALPQLGELNRGKSKHRPRDDPKLYGGPYPFIQTGDVRRSNGVIRNFSQTYSEFGLKQSRLWAAGTLCITIAANIAETGILAMAACFPDSIVGFVSDHETLTRFMEAFVRASREELERFAPATAQKNINLAVLDNLVVPLPPLTEQHRIVAELERHLSISNELKTELEHALHRIEYFRNAVLKQAFDRGHLERNV
jgi:type I restriction enzyme S subunit